MSSFELIENFFAVLYALIPVTIMLFREHPDRPQMRYFALFDPMILPDMLLFGVPILAAILGKEWFRIFFANGGFLLETMVVLAVYYAVMLLIFPLLRRCIRAEGIACLWVIPSEICYLNMLTRSNSRLLPRKWIIPLGNLNLTRVAAIWLAGFALVMIVALIRHLVFRRQILRDAIPAGEHLQQCWNRVQQDLGLERKRRQYRLVVSGSLPSPLSVGIWRRTIRVVLPDRSYSEEELELILRHEMIHILHSDSRTKLFMTFCTALCWFNPFLWLSMGKCADDLELSCDEMVLEDCEEPVRRKYADLILTAAGDDRGFTTCLSAKAESLKYRLQNVLHPGKKRRGYLVIFVCFLLLVLGMNRVGFSFGRGNVAELDREGYFRPEYLDSEFALILEDRRSGLPPTYHVTDLQALQNYISGLETCRLEGSRYAIAGDEIVFMMRVPQPDGRIKTYEVTLSEQCVMLSDLSLSGVYYFVPDGIDMEYIRSLLVPANE